MRASNEDPGAGTVRSLADAEHWSHLDGLRGVSVLMVIGVHTRPELIPGGFLGVDLFFVLSGFLITTLLLREWRRSGTIGLRPFWLRRALRLFPALLVFLAVTALWQLVWPGKDPRSVWWGSLFALVYVYNWVIAFQFVAMDHLNTNHLWSLSVEEQFYILWPWLLLLALRANIGVRWLVGGLVLACLIPLGIRLSWSSAYDNGIYFRTDARLDCILAGVIAAIAAWSGLSREARWLVPAQVAAAAVLLAHAIMRDLLLHAYIFHIGFTVLAVSGGVLILGLVERPVGILRAVLDWPVLRWFGRVSYSLYLWHWPIFYGLNWEPEQQSWFRMLSAFVLSVLAATLSHYGIERPFLRLKERIGKASLRSRGAGLALDGRTHHL